MSLSANIIYAFQRMCAIIEMQMMHVVLIMAFFQNSISLVTYVAIYPF